MNSIAKQKRIENFEIQRQLKPLKSNWSYAHSFGVIHVESWGDPYLIVTEHKFFNGVSWGTTHYKLGITFKTEEEAFIKANELDEKYDFPSMFNSKKSEEILIKIQNDFPTALIKK